MSRYVGQYISTCDLCLQTKLIQCLSLRELYLLLVPDIRLETISVNFIVKLLESARFDTVMIEVDSAFKRAHFIPTHTTVTVEGGVRLFLYNTWKLHSLLTHDFKVDYSL